MFSGSSSSILDHIFAYNQVRLWSNEDLLSTDLKKRRFSFFLVFFFCLFWLLNGATVLCIGPFGYSNFSETADFCHIPNENHVFSLSLKPARHTFRSAKVAAINLFASAHRQLFELDRFILYRALLFQSSLKVVLMSFLNPAPISNWSNFKLGLIKHWIRE